VSPEEIDAIAEATAAKIAQGLLRMPDELRTAAETAGPGWYSTPGTLMPGPNAYYLVAMTRTGGIELQIKHPDGHLVWQAVIV